MNKAVLIGAQLAYANFSRAVVTGADFSQADLSKAKTHRANFSEARLDGAKMDSIRATDPVLTEGETWVSPIRI